MFKSTKTKVIALALVAAVALGGAVYATTALAVGSATAAPAAAPTTQTATDPQLRASILDMLKDRMGLTGPAAETFADQMIARMQSANPNFDLQAMIDWCNQYVGGNSPNGANPSSGGYLAGPCGGARNSGPGSAPRGMMGGGSNYGGRGMMGGTADGAALR
jgi:hypothetical protein